MKSLTQPSLDVNLLPLLPHGAVEFDSSELIGSKPQSKRFFYVQRSIPLCGAGRGSLAACRLRLAGLSTPFSLAPMFDSIRRGLKIQLIERLS